MMRAVEKYDVNVMGLTLSHNQKTHIERLFDGSPGDNRMDVRPSSWEEFNEPVDRIVSIGAFEHFGFAKYQGFFQKAYKLMPDDGVMLLHSIVAPSTDEYHERQLQITMSRLRFVKFILDEIFPGGRLPLIAQVEEHAASAGFQVTRVQSRIQTRPGDCGHLARGLRQIPALPERLCRSVPQRLCRRLPIHLRKELAHRSSRWSCT
jgi:cyclopropane-fatty-acyl-phospholipid synthase